MHPRIPYSLFLFLSCLLLLNCEENETIIENHIEASDTSYPIYKKYAYIDPDSTLPIPERRKSIYFFVVEAGGVLWQEECYPMDSIDKQRIQNAFDSIVQEDTLVIISRSDIDTVQIYDPYCMRGECGGSQIALKNSKNIIHGILTPTKFLQKRGEFHSLASSWKDSTLNQYDEVDSIYVEDYQWMPPNTPLFWGNQYYSDSTGNFILQFKTNGFEQENGWPAFLNVHYRFIVNGEKKSWISSRVGGTNLPEPIGFFKSGNDYTLIWWHGEGICCPSSSMAWFEEISFKKDSTIVSLGETFPGGFGQPCD